MSNKSIVIIRSDIQSMFDDVRNGEYNIKSYVSELGHGDLLRQGGAGVRLGDHFLWRGGLGCAARGKICMYISTLCNR